MDINEFKTEAESLIEQFQALIDQLPQKGNTASECQKMQLQQSLNELEYSVNGTEEADLEDDEGKKTYT
jgi:hypothetical protein